MSWVKQFTQVLREGVWLPRWLPDSNGGYGSPIFVFYSPLVYYVTALFQWAFGSLIFSMKLVRGLGLFLSGLAMWVHASDFLDKRIALAVSIVYLAIPFHVLDVSYWSLYAETWAWVWFPLILFFLHRIRKDPGVTVNVLGLSLGYAGLILTHLVSAYMFSLLILAFWLICWMRGEAIDRQLRTLAALLAGLALAAFYLFPALYEQKFVRLEYSTMLPEFDFHNTFLFFPNSALTATNPFQSKTIHLLQLITLLQCIWMLLSMRLQSPKKSPCLRLHQETSFQFAVAIVCLFLMTSLSTPIWHWVPGLSRIQFSTRWLSIYSLAVAVIAGAGFQVYCSGTTGMAKLMVMGHLTLTFAAALASLLIILGGCFLKDECNKTAAAGIYNAPEYNPRGMKHWKQRVIYPEDPPYSLIEGKGQVTIKRWSSHDRELIISADGPVRVRIRTLYYPGWTASCDGRRMASIADPETGQILVNIPAGLHQLQIMFKNTWWRNLAFGTSALAAIGMFVAAVGKRRRK
jgi:6-pyruvoyl-tetrahydropterin synthase-like protein